MSIHNPIIVLDQLTANQIAAGEVVERPASVVKELVENSIDAGSTRVQIEVQAGGIQLIQVNDNGVGMPRDEVLLAFQRHATSKIRTADDLTGVTTMGFRGEALPSIAAVARVSVVTRTAPEQEGTTVTLEPGQEPVVGSTGCPVGTTITVRDLFFNAPARRKFLKTPVGEAGAVGDIIQRLALAHPRIAFTLSIDRKTTLMTTGGGDLRATAASVYGLEAAEKLLPVSHSGPWGCICGLVTPPEITKGTRHHQTFVVNGRYVRSRTLTRALDLAYHTLLGVGRHPLTILHLDMAPALIDVNVHPTKLEVRFQQDLEVTGHVRAAVAAALRTYPQVPVLRSLPDLSSDRSPTQEKTNPFGDRQLFTREIPQAAASDDRLAEDPAPETGSSLFQIHEHTVEFLTTPNDIFHPILHELQPVGQLGAAYILAEGRDGLYVVDQHAAHERLMYEKLQNDIQDAQNLSQILIAPTAVELTHEEAAQLFRHILDLTDLGFVLEHFGGNTFLVRAEPAVPGHHEVNILLKDLLDLWREFPDMDTADFRETAVKMMACRQAVKAHQHLSSAEMRSLLKDLARCREPYTCPHGRPTVVLITMAELARRFKRSAPS